MHFKTKGFRRILIANLHTTELAGHLCGGIEMLYFISIKEYLRVEPLGESWIGQNLRERYLLEFCDIYEVRFEPRAKEIVDISALDSANARRVFKSFVDNVRLANFCLLIAIEDGTEKMSEWRAGNLSKISA